MSEEKHGVSIQFAESEHEKLKKIAKKEYRSVSAVVRMAVEKQLAEEEQVKG